MKEKITYLSEIISALQILNGAGSLKEINEVIEKENRLPYIYTNINWKNNVSATIQRHCSSTKSYKGKEDIVYSVYGLGEGYWGLKDYINSEVENPIIQRQISAIKSLNIDTTDKEMIIKARLGQGKFREQLIQKYHKCIITGIDDKRLLLASHIKPWRSASNKERLSSENGLLLSPLYDKLFDTGLITFDENMRILISNDISENNILKINIDATRIYIDDPSLEMQKYMKFHRKNIFKGQ